MQFKNEWVQSAYKMGKYLYECGRYAQSISHLYFCLMVMQPSDPNYLNLLWGILAVEILTLNWSSALENLNRLREYIDNSNFNNTQALQQRTWLIHWSVFVFVNHAKGRDYIIEMFLYRPLYLNTIQTMCPHVLRYLATAVIINPGRRNALKDLIKVIQQESYTYRDPITEFLECLYVNFDFEGARLKLHECQTVIINDFFIIQWLNEFVENARLMIFETFCRIHQCITIRCVPVPTPTLAHSHSLIINTTITLTQQHVRRQAEHGDQRGRVLDRQPDPYGAPGREDRLEARSHRNGRQSAQSVPAAGREDRQPVRSLGRHDRSGRAQAQSQESGFQREQLEVLLNTPLQSVQCVRVCVRVDVHLGRGKLPASNYQQPITNKDSERTKN